MRAARSFGWGIGLVMMAVQPIAGLAILLVALMATIHLAGQQKDGSSAKGEDTR